MLHQRVEAGSRFIEDDQLWLMQEPLHNANLFLVPVGKIVDPSFQVQFHQVRQFMQPLAAIFFVETGGILEQVEDLHAFVIKNLGRQVPDLLPDLEDQT